MPIKETNSSPVHKKRISMKNIILKQIIFMGYFIPVAIHDIIWKLRLKFIMPTIFSVLFVSAVHWQTKKPKIPIFS